MDKNNNKIFVILSVVAIAILFLIFYLLLGMKNEKIVKQDLSDVDGSDIAVAVKKINESLIERAKRIPSMSLRGIDETDHVLGSAEAEVDVVFYGDYDDEFTGVFDDTLKKAIKEFDEKIRVAFRHFPQRQHSNSYKMALSAECADAQDKFWEMHDELLSLKKDENFSHENLMKQVAGLGIDSEEFDKCVHDDEYKDKILNQISEAGSYTIIGTPTTYVNGIVLTGATPWEDFVDSAGFERKGLESVIEGELNL